VRPKHAEWIRETAHIPVAEYEKFPAAVRPRSSTPRLGDDGPAAGMQYLVITSKHHDGFRPVRLGADDLGFWRHAVQSAICSPNWRLPAADTASASAPTLDHGLAPSRLPAGSELGEGPPVAGADSTAFERYLHAQVTEVVQRYHPAVMWFDGEWENTDARTRRAAVRTVSSARPGDDRQQPRRRAPRRHGRLPATRRKRAATSPRPSRRSGHRCARVDWETCMTMNDNWGFNKADAHWKPAGDLLQKLCDIVSKGGNFLLNIGPRADAPSRRKRGAARSARRLDAAQRQRHPRHVGESVRHIAVRPLHPAARRRRHVLNLLVFDWPKDGRLVLPGSATT